jgi:hypothetical protein
MTVMIETGTGKRLSTQPKVITESFKVIFNFMKKFAYSLVEHSINGDIPLKDDREISMLE